MKRVRILLVEDNPGDAVLVQEVFDDGNITIESLEHVTTLWPLKSSRRLHLMRSSGPRIARWVRYRVHLYDSLGKEGRADCCPHGYR